MRTSLVATVPIALVATGCASTVLEAAVSNGWKPAPGVEIALDCPSPGGGAAGARRRLLGTTDEGGRFELGDATGRALPESCDVMVGQRRFAMKTVCVESADQYCKRAVIETDLTVSDGRSKD